MIHGNSFDTLARSRTPLSTHVIQQIVRSRLNELGWSAAVYSLDVAPSALTAVHGGSLRSVRLKSGMSKKALGELLEKLEGGAGALELKQRPAPRKRKRVAPTNQIDLEGWLDAR